jgi:hypothetical protein
MSYKWTFEQLEGRGDRKKLELDGWNAPFGRPRKEPVIREVIKSRVQTTRYPGASNQSRHAFGTNWETTELKGRWSTRFGVKTANEVADDWIKFVRDERTCRIAWGFIVSYTGFISELEIARESEHEIAWRMKLELDGRDDMDKRAVPPRILNPIKENFNDLKAFVTLSKKLREPTLPDIAPDFLESLDNLAATLNGPAAELNKLVGRIDDIEKASYSTLQHFRGAIAGFRTAILGMREVAVNTGIDTAMLVRTAESDIAWAKYQADIDNQTDILLEQIAAIDRRAALAQKAEVSKTIVAEEGDSWESLSTRALGGPNNAGEIRQLNGIRYGEKPVAGETYLVP